MNSGKDRSRTIAAIIGFAVLAALGPLVFSVAGNLLGIIYIVAVIAFFFVIVNRWDRGGDVEVATTTDSRRWVRSPSRPGERRSATWSTGIASWPGTAASSPATTGSR